LGNAALQAQPIITNNLTDNSSQITSNQVNNDEINNIYPGHDLQAEVLTPNSLKPWSSPVTPIPVMRLSATLEPNSNSGNKAVTEDIDGNGNRPEDVAMNQINKAQIETVISSAVDNQLAHKAIPDKKQASITENLLEGKTIDNAVAGKKTPAAGQKATKVLKKQNRKATWVYYLEPVVNTVAFGGESLKQPQAAGLSAGLPMVQKENNVLHNSAFGMEAGAQLNYTLSRKLQFTAGAHFTYSGYHIISNEVHPTFATLVLRNPASGTTYSRSFITHYGDGTGQSVVSLHNYSWQASIPFGLQYELSGNSKVQFNLGAALEPSLVLKSDAYILSSDGNNYLNDPSLLRKWNLNSNFGAFVSFSSARFKWQIGPNIRYQWMSTYKKDYTVKEHLINYGIRLGISK